jgi:hypothetical protein
LCHRTASGSSPWGGCRGRVVQYCFTDVETTPQAGQPAALEAVVTTFTNRTPRRARPVTRSTWSTATPGRPK